MTEMFAGGEPRAMGRRAAWSPSTAWPAVALMVATWPVWRWYGRRMSDGSDEPWGLLALATLLVLGWSERCREAVSVAVPLRWLAVYVGSYPWAPPLARAGLAGLALGSLLFPRRGQAARWGLLALSLPVVATLQFYVGYPLRAFAAAVSAWSLQACGWPVTREGSMLRWAGETVMVDVPCSGIHMLWFGLYLAVVFSALHRLSTARTLLCAAGAALIVVMANAVRATILFFKEAHLVQWPEWTHAAVGVALFAGAAMLLARFAERLRKPVEVA